MKNIVVTGAGGFIGLNLVAALRQRDNVVTKTIDIEDDPATLESNLHRADIIYHLAGINRPKTEDEFFTGNAGLTETIIGFLEKNNRSPVIVLASSIQAALDNPYGKSKKAAEEVLLDFNKKTGTPVCIYRLTNVFGKWSQPNYNTVVATFCHNIAREVDISISDPSHELELVYIDDVVQAFLMHLDTQPDSLQSRYAVEKSFQVSLGELAEKIRKLHAVRKTLVVPDLSDDFMKCLYATYLSFLPENELAQPVKLHSDNRGWLFELLKSEHFGQIFVSKTLPGITRGDHYHHTKLEKFCVIQGQGIVRFRHINTNKILDYPVNDKEIKIVDIPPGYTHSIENNSDREMICLFWANQMFDPEQPDTYWEKVIQ